MSRKKQFLGAIPIAMLLAFSAAQADPPVWDTVSTACVSLKVHPDGRFGGGDGTQGIGLDYYPADCDPSAALYLYSGSPVVMWVSGTDTIGNWTIYDNDSTTPVGFYPVAHTPPYPAGDSGEVFHSLFLTHDQSIGIEKTWYAPQAADSCNFMIQRLRVWSNDGLAHSGLLIGEAVDWDIPSDSGTRNGSNFNTSMEMVYQYGAEWNQDDLVECQNNDARFGAVRYLTMFKAANGDTTGFDLAPYGVRTADNATYVTGNPYGFAAGQLYSEMSMGGWMRYYSTNPDSEFVDLHTTMTFVRNHTLSATDTLVIYTAFVTVQNGTAANLVADANKAKAWGELHVIPSVPCCRLRGDWNHDGSVKVSDCTGLINYMFRGGSGPVCFEEGDANGDGTIDLRDLVGLIIPFLFRFGPPPPPC